MPKQEIITQLQEKAVQIRRLIIEMLAEAGSGHPGGSLSAADIVTTLFFHKMKHDPKNPKWPERDRFVLSKGHAAPVLYSALMLAGYIDEDLKLTLRKMKSPLQGHPDMLQLPGVEISTGSLGQGLSIAVGMALANKLDKIDAKIYCLVGDGENQEGNIWEGAMSAAHQKLDNLRVIVDYNKLQIDGAVSDVKGIEPLSDKWRAFGFEIIEIDGHDYDQIIAALDKADEIKGKPVAIIANTVKGKGISFMENQVGFHGVAPSADEKETALRELS